MRNLISILILWFGCFSAFGQMSQRALMKLWEDESKTDQERLIALNNICTSEFIYSKPDSALYFAQMAYDFAKSKSLKKEMAMALHIKGKAYSNLEEYSKAIKFQKQSITINESINNLIGTTKALNSLGNVYLSKGEANVDSTIILGNQALSLALASENIEEIANSAELLQKAYQEKGNYNFSLEMKKLYQSTKDSILDLENNQTAFLEKDQPQIDLNDKANQLPLEKTLQKYRIWNYILFGSLAIIIFGFSAYQKKRNQQNLLKQKDLLLEIDQLKKKLTLQSVASDRSQPEFALNKAKIEKAINAKLGVTSWMILKIIFEKPSVSNQEIAEEISLSLEGISSSLRRMYTAFDIKSTSNKKITLIMKATRISIEA